MIIQSLYNYYSQYCEIVQEDLLQMLDILDDFVKTDIK